ncbi:MAG TPA: DUF805 domain-containing protein [Caulobacteraceae bacterium]|nr:DUF805 domain-containing protein [Caulobacteraceae bacterium]
MDGRIDWSALFFSASGRAARTPFLIAAVILIVAWAVYEAVVSGALHWMTGWIVYPVLLFCGACVLSKRLHDRGKTGWWAALVLFAVVMVWPHPEGVLDFIGLLVIGWAVVELALMPGEQGANRFGPNPMRPVQVQVNEA